MKTLLKMQFLANINLIIVLGVYCDDYPSKQPIKWPLQRFSSQSLPIQNITINANVYQYNL